MKTEAITKTDPDKLSIDGDQKNHVYAEGKWEREKKHQWEVRVDHCLLCGCERHWVRNKHIPNGHISTFFRSGIIYHSNEEPLCWG